MAVTLVRSDLILRLGATVGVAKAQAAITAAAAALGFTEETLDLAQTNALLDHLGATVDIVGIAARLLKTQISLQSSGGRGGTPVPH